MKTIFFLKPVFKETIWGGTQLHDVFNYTIPSNKTGECWGISAHPNGDCEIIGMEGYTLSRLWKEHHQELSNVQSEEFPVLIKYIDAHDDLSIQVHPDNAYAKKVENSLGKHECWYILPSSPKAKLVFGHKAQDREALEMAIENKEYDHLLNVVDVKEGDFFDIPPGTIHAIKEGCLIYESQQSSDITYRLYDYDRRDKNGNLRELHVQKAIDVITIPQSNQKIEPTQNEFGHHYLTTEFFSVDGWDIQDELRVENKNMLLCSVIEGKGTFCDQPIQLGDHFIVSMAQHDIHVTGPVKLMVTSI